MSDHYYYLKDIKSPKIRERARLFYLGQATNESAYDELFKLYASILDPKLPIMTSKEQTKIFYDFMEMEAMVCEDVFYDGFKLPTYEWCEWCLGDQDDFFKLLKIE